MRLVARALPVPAISKRRAVIGRGADEGKAERDVDAVVESERLDRDQRLVVVHAERGVVGSPRARRGTSCRPAAGRGRRSPRRRSASTAGRTIASSSAPSMPSSPACGLSPATASRGSAMPKRRRGRARRSRPCVTMRSRRQGTRHIRERDVDRDRHDPQLRPGEHHHRRRGAPKSFRRARPGIPCGRGTRSRPRSAPSSGSDW